jgi:hypothetical protein
MARGFESKMVEFNQEEAAREQTKTERLTSEEQARLTRRITLDLARKRAVTDLASATRFAHKAMLEQAIKALDDQLKDLG